MKRPKPNQPDEIDLAAQAVKFSQLSTKSFASAQEAKDTGDHRGHAQHYRTGQMYREKAEQVKIKLDAIRVFK